MIVALATCFACGVQAEPAVVQTPRAFGYMLGDLVEQRILIGNDVRAADVATILATSLSTGRVSPWLERRPAAFVTDADTRRWLTLDYQVINSPREPNLVSLPPLQLRLSTGKVLDVPASPLAIAPLTPLSAADTGRLAGLQPDRLLPTASDTPMRRALGAWVAATVGVLVVWLGWWLVRNRRDALRLPFASAWNDAGGRSRLGFQRAGKGASLDADPQAWRRLHHALNEAAGEVVHAGSLDALLARAPYLQTLRPQLERFYQRSTERFFGELGVAAPFSLRDLYRELYHAEKRHHR